MLGEANFSFKLRLKSKDCFVAALLTMTQKYEI